MHLQNFYKPHPLLHEHVRYYWSLDFENDSSEEFVIKLMADRFPRLTFQVMEMNSAIKLKEEKIPISTISGVNTIPTDYNVSKRYSQFAVSFYPHALKSLFEIDAHEVTNELPDLINFLPSEINYLLQEAPDNYKRAEIMNHALLERLRLSRYSRVDPIIKELVSKEPLIRGNDLGSLPLECNISSRSLQRKFKSWIGLTPKKYLQICRFEKVYNSMTSNDFDKLSDIAFMYDYSDQSHFIREFKNHSGLSPLLFLKGNLYGGESNGILTDKNDFSRAKAKNV